jgi:hypothetical protein
MLEEVAVLGGKEGSFRECTGEFAGEDRRSLYDRPLFGYEGQKLKWL